MNYLINPSNLTLLVNNFKGRPGAGWLIPGIPATWEAGIKRMRFEARRPYLKNAQHKNRAGAVAQVVECLPSTKQRNKPKQTL
jgi:hypothetical protein